MVNEIICLGDSITGYTNHSTLDNVPRTYSEFLEAILRKNNRTNPVINAGIAGETSDRAQLRVNEWMTKIPSAKYFILCYGINDLANLQDGSYDIFDSMSMKIIRNLDYAAAPITSSPFSRRMPFLMNLPNGDKSMKVRTNMHNANLLPYCHKAEIPHVDINSYLKPEHFIDGVHPNDQGSRIIAEEVSKRLLRFI